MGLARVSDPEGRCRYLPLHSADHWLKLWEAPLCLCGLLSTGTLDEEGEQVSVSQAQNASLLDAYESPGILVVGWVATQAAIKGPF